MGYPEMMDFGDVLKRKTNAPDTALNLAAAAAQYAGFAVLQPISIKRMLFFVTTQVTAGTTAPQVGFVQRPTYGSTSGAVTLGVMTIPTGTAVGKVVYKDISDSTRVLAGQELSMDIIRQAVDGGTAAGAGWLSMIWELSPDADANNSALIASA